MKFRVWACHINILYHHPNGQQGIPWMVVDQNNKVVWCDEGEPFGNAVPDEDLDKDGKDFTLSTRDKETGRNQNYYRDYNSETGRYIEGDPIGFAGGKPIQWMDPKVMEVLLCHRPIDLPWPLSTQDH